MAAREDNLLAMVKNAIYGYERSPYLKLLKQAGCEYGDFERMVRLEGIEATLTKLREEGVYISIDEFKGKNPVRRGGKEFFFNETDFDNPFTARHLSVSTGGSHGAGMRLHYDLDFLEQDRAVYTIHLFHSWNITEIPHVMWTSIMPGSGPLELLQYAKAGQLIMKWYTPIESTKLKPSLVNRLGTLYIVYAGRLFGAPLPKPEYITLDDAWKIAEWVSNAIRNYGACYVHTNPSRAVALCKVAKNKGINITGTKFFLGWIAHNRE